MRVIIRRLQMEILRKFLNKLDQLNITHGLFALIICVPVSITELYIYAACSVSAYFYGRERRDHEHQAGLNPHKDWYIGHWPFLWQDNTRWDLLSGVIGAWMPCPFYIWYFYG